MNCWKIKGVGSGFHIRSQRFVVSSSLPASPLFYTSLYTFIWKLLYLSPDIFIQPLLLEV